MNLSLMNNSLNAIKILLLTNRFKAWTVFADYVCNRKYDRLKNEKRYKRKAETATQCTLPSYRSSC